MRIRPATRWRPPPFSLFFETAFHGLLGMHIHAPPTAPARAGARRRALGQAEKKAADARARARIGALESQLADARSALSDAQAAASSAHAAVAEERWAGRASAQVLALEIASLEGREAQELRCRLEALEDSLTVLQASAHRRRAGAPPAPSAAHGAAWLSQAETQPPLSAAAVPQPGAADGPIGQGGWCEPQPHAGVGTKPASRGPAPFEAAPAPLSAHSSAGGWHGSAASHHRAAAEPAGLTVPGNFPSFPAGERHHLESLHDRPRESSSSRGGSRARAPSSGSGEAHAGGGGAHRPSARAARAHARPAAPAPAAQPGGLASAHARSLSVSPMPTGGRLPARASAMALPSAEQLHTARAAAGGTGASCAAAAGARGRSAASARSPWRARRAGGGDAWLHSGAAAHGGEIDSEIAAHAPRPSAYPLHAAEAQQRRGAPSSASSGGGGSGGGSPFSDDAQAALARVAARERDLSAALSQSHALVSDLHARLAAAESEVSGAAYNYY